MKSKTGVRTIKYYLLLLVLAGVQNEASCKVWKVGSSRAYTVPSAVANLVADGDTVEIDAGVYNDCVTWTKNNLLIRGGGNGYAHLQNTVCGLKGIFVLYGANITIENIEFSGAAIADADGDNAAGIRAQGPGKLTVRNCYIHDNQMGLLEGMPADSTVDVLVEKSIFAYNGVETGSGAGYDHNIYISRVRSFTFQYNYSHGCRQGANVKSRARKTYILYNRIMDNADGDSQRGLHIANGGQCYIIGNLLEKGPLSPFPKTTISFCEECQNGTGANSTPNPGPHELYIINNTIVCDQSGAQIFDLWGGSFSPTGTAAGSQKDTMLQVFKMYNNIIAGPANLYRPYDGYNHTMFKNLDSARNIITNNISSAGLINAANYDYHLTQTSPAIDKGTDPGSANSFSLTPVFQYVDPANMQPRAIINSKIDIGAYEYGGTATAINDPDLNSHVIIYPNPSSGSFSVGLVGMSDQPLELSLYDQTGRLLLIRKFENGNLNIIDHSEAGQSGIYLLKISTDRQILTRKVMFIASE